VFEPRLTHAAGDTAEEILDHYERGKGRSFHALTAGGTWRGNAGNLLTCVDIMMLPEFRGMRIDGERLADILLDDLLRQLPRDKWIVTYSPDIALQADGRGDALAARRALRPAHPERAAGLQQPRRRGHGLPAPRLRRPRRSAAAP
jgi:hypothetical protein